MYIGTYINFKSDFLYQYNKTQINIFGILVMKIKIYYTI